MTFEEIFNQDGLYKASSFRKGIAFEVKDGNLYLVTYKDVDDMFPDKTVADVYKELFKKDYQKVFTRQSLFE